MPIAALDLFCGIGGLTHGLQLSGIPVIAGFDKLIKSVTIAGLIPSRSNLTCWIVFSDISITT